MSSAAAAAAMRTLMHVILCHVLHLPKRQRFC
jgi:hypothetical protein